MCIWEGFTDVIFDLFLRDLKILRFPANVVSQEFRQISFYFGSYVPCPTLKNWVFHTGASGQHKPVITLDTVTFANGILGAKHAILAF